MYRLALQPDERGYLRSSRGDREEDLRNAGYQIERRVDQTARQALHRQQQRLSTLPQRSTPLGQADTKRLAKGARTFSASHRGGSRIRVGLFWFGRLLRSARPL